MYREEIRKEFLIPEHQKVVGMVGILDIRKNQNFLIEIAKELPDVIFLLVGEGPNRLKLEEKCTGLKNVIFTGNRNDVYKFYSAFDIFAFPFSNSPVFCIRVVFPLPGEEQTLITNISFNFSRIVPATKSFAFSKLSDTCSVSMLPAVSLDDFGLTSLIFPKIYFINI